jgi:hypothetical protein
MNCAAMAMNRMEYYKIEKSFDAHFRTQEIDRGTGGHPGTDVGHKGRSCESDCHKLEKI